MTAEVPPELPEPDDATDAAMLALAQERLARDSGRRFPLDEVLRELGL